MTNAVTMNDMVTCVIREIGMRQRVYPKWVKENRMKQDAATREIEAMKGVLEYLLDADITSFKSRTKFAVDHIGGGMVSVTAAFNGFSMKDNTMNVDDLKEIMLDHGISGAGADRLLAPPVT